LIGIYTRLRWALNIASALAFLHTKSIIFEGLSPNTVHLRSDLSAALANLDVAAYKEQPGSDGVVDGYLSPDWFQKPLADQPETWIKASQDVFAFGSLLYFLMHEHDPESFENEEDMPELKDGDMSDIIRKCWLKEYENMDEVVVALTDVVHEQGLELNGKDDIRVDSSAEQFEACGIFSQMVRRFKQSKT
jgi:hypothetical protein